MTEEKEQQLRKKIRVELMRYWDHMHNEGKESDLTGAAGATMDAVSRIENLVAEEVANERKTVLQAYRNATGVKDDVFTKSLEMPDVR
jgi:hypothetical protein